jgi:hypothetical protein
MDLESNGTIDLDVLGERLRLWFVQRKWEVEATRGPSSYAIQARKAGIIRISFGACRALIVVCQQEPGKTKVSVRQGSWTENIWSNAAWFVTTGGMNLAFTLWSFQVQRQFQNYVKQVLDGLRGH